MGLIWKCLTSGCTFSNGDVVSAQGHVDTEGNDDHTVAMTLAPS